MPCVAKSIGLPSSKTKVTLWDGSQTRHMFCSGCISYIPGGVVAVIYHVLDGDLLLRDFNNFLLYRVTIDKCVTWQVCIFFLRVSQSWVHFREINQKVFVKMYFFYLFCRPPNVHSVFGWTYVIFCLAFVR